MNEDQKPGNLSVDEPQHVVRTYASDMAALSQAAGQSAAPSNTPTPPPPTTPPPTAPAEIPTIETPVTEDRTAILARLRQQAQKMPEPAASRMNLGAAQIGATPVVPIQATSPIPSIPEVVPPPPLPPPQTSPEAIQHQIPPIKQPSEQPIPIHTYTSDFRDHVEERSASPFAVLAAQQDAPRSARPVRTTYTAKREPSAPILTYALAGGGALLLLVAAILLYGAFGTSKKGVAVPVAPGVPSLIFADYRDQLSGTGSSLMEALAQAETTSLPENNVLVTYISVATSTPQGTYNGPVPGGFLIQALGLPAPDILLRNIDANSTVGVVHAGAEERAFFILRVASYESTFRGMLSWEPTIMSDLGALYPAYAQPQPTPSTSSGTSTSPQLSVVSAPSSQQSVGGMFVDEVVDNHDVRAYRDSQGRTVLLYGYFDQQTLIIARDEAAFSELITRLSSTSQQ